MRRTQERFVSEAVVDAARLIWAARALVGQRGSYTRGLARSEPRYGEDWLVASHVCPYM